MNRACRNCMWWDAIFDVEDSGGICRGAPPQIIVAADGGDETWWPTTGPADWCGSFRMTETPEPAE